jgi:hypothetical protein
VPAPLPELTPQRLIERVSEAMQLVLAPQLQERFPSWTQRVMRILKDQFIPDEYASVLSNDGSAFVEGVGVAWTGNAQDLVRATGTGAAAVAAQMADKLALDEHAKDVAVQVGAGTFADSPQLQERVLKRIFAANRAERRAFAEGLVLGNRLPELLQRQAGQRTTDATNIYLLLWLYWPEIASLRSVPEVARALRPFFGANGNLAGRDWDERIRKLANRIGLSFAAKQRTRRRSKR